MSWFQRKITPAGIPVKEERPDEGERRVRTEGLWLKCEGCREIIWKKDLEATLNTCGKCGYHFRMDARDPLKLLFDGGVYEELDAELQSSDPLGFVDSKPYRERLRATQA